MKLALHGATGRMGRTLVSLLDPSTDSLVGACGQPGGVQVGKDLGEAMGRGPLGVLVQDQISSALLGAEVVIDFSNARAVSRLAREAARAKVAIVSGTTGLTDEAQKALDDAAKSVPVLWAPNFSVGIQVLAELVRHAAKRLGADFDVELVEVHHRGKADAPSGTAVRLAQEVEAVRGPMQQLSGRQGLVGARSPEQLGVLAVRGGDVVGDHTLHFMGLGERLELTHRATSREVFARGALLAARALVGKAPGRYSLADVLPAL